MKTALIGLVIFLFSLMFGWLIGSLNMLIGIVIGIVLMVVGLFDPTTSGRSKEELKERFCPDCGRSIPWSADQCPYCGKTFKALIKDAETD